MANKNHELDHPIIEAAKQEFLQNGFQSTSIHQIAKRAKVTTGAIYTRYQGKDELFCSLIEGFLQALEKERKDNKKAYIRYCVDKNFDRFYYYNSLSQKGDMSQWILYRKNNDRECRVW